MPRPSSDRSSCVSSERRWRDLHRSLVALPEFDASALGLDLWESRLALVACRRDVAPDTPLLTVLLGPTGAGKSTLLSALVGRAVAIASPLRPCTTRPLAIGSASALARLANDPFLAGRAPDVEWRAEERLPPGFAGQVVVDTPDFDSVNDENRDRARPLFERADRLIVVLTPEKYGDAIVWQTIDALRPLGNFAGAVFNKMESPAALDDATRLLAARGPGSLLVVPRLPDGADLPARIAASSALSELLLCPDPATLRARLLCCAAAEEQRLRVTRIAPFVGALERTGRALEHRIRSFHEGLRAEIERTLALRLDDALRQELQQRLVEALARFDVTRGARELLALPLRRLRGWLTGSAANAESSPAVDPIEWLASRHEDRFHRLHLDLVARVREFAAEARHGTTPPWPWPRIDSPARSASHALLLESLRHLEREIRAESDRIAQQLPPRLHVQFIGSQVVFHAVLLALFLKTGGMLGGGEVAVQGLLSPFLARLVNQLVSSAEVEAIERRLGERLARRLEEALRPITTPLDDALSRQRARVPDLATFEADARALEQSLAVTSIGVP